MLKAKDLINLSEDELKGKLISLRQELFKLNQQRYAGNVEKPHLFREIRKDIARLETALNDKTRKRDGQEKNSKEG